MDQKDLELIGRLAADGRSDASAISMQLCISPENVERRLRLMLREGIIEGFSAFFDRRMFGYDTTFVKLHFLAKDRRRVLEGILSLPQIAMVYPNMDGFMLCEVVHYDRDSLASAIKEMERLADPNTVSAAFEPLLPDEVPKAPRGTDLKVLSHLVRDGRATAEAMAKELGMKVPDVERSVSSLISSGAAKVLPLVQEGEVQPFPSFSVLVILKHGCSIDSCFPEVLRISREAWHSVPLRNPGGVWMRCFGRDLHGMDGMLERFRRLDFVSDVQVMMPEGIVFRREVDQRLLLPAKGKKDGKK